ncbi:MAG TPA: adenylate/guanylate cyclase domain-containing protein [Ktedonobacteraceae bacterium]|nr:adenylate/guanylate cyclase domain-containing protein [Ktedonobacteraceae bacterium]
MMKPEHRHSSRSVDQALLASLPLFAHIPSDLLELVALEHTVCFYHDGDVIMHQGDQADGLFILLHGQARVLNDGIFLVARSPYDILGELAFINQTVRNATIIAQGAVQALVLRTPLVERLMVNPIFLRNLLSLVAEKLQEATTERAFRFRNELLLFREFRAHLSPEVAQRLLATGKQYGMPRFIDAVLLFADIRSFTERSAMMTPEQIAQELNSYLDAVVSVIHRHEGMVDKFIGDAVFALWGIAPGEKDPIQQAFACAKEMLTTAAGLSFGGDPISLGIGLNAGRVFVGNVGGEEKRQFTVLGHPVNLAARCESATKELRAAIVMGEAFALRLPSPLLSSLYKHEQIPVKGAGLQTLYAYTPTTEGEKGSAHELE